MKIILVFIFFVVAKSEKCGPICTGKTIGECGSKGTRLPDMPIYWLRTV